MPKPVKPGPPAPFEDALCEVRRQQQASNESFHLLQEQHHQWQQAVEELLAHMKLSSEKASTEVGDDGSKNLTPGLYCRQESEAVSTFSQLHNTSHSEKSVGVKSMARSPGFHVQENSPLKKIISEMLQEEKQISESDDNGHGCQGFARLQKKAKEIVDDSQWFEYVTGAVICLNMVTICVEVEASLTSGPSPWATQVERGFLLIYTVEVVLRLLAGGCRTFQNPWFVMDLFLVLVGILALVVVPLLGDDVDLAGFEKLLVVRGLRLLRLVRALRMVRQFKVMWRLVYSLLNAGQTMMSTTALIVLALFIFGCVAVEIITKDPDLAYHEATAHIVESSFKNLPSSILTLLQFVTLDSVAAIYYPLVMTKPYLIVYFIPIIVVVSVGLMNLVTAVLVESALESAAQEVEESKKELKQKIKSALPLLLETFQTLDADGSGFITSDEINAVPVDVLPPSVLESLPFDNMQDLFEMLDVDGTGTLDLNEFVEGLMNLALLDVPIWTIQSQRMLRSVRSLATKIDEDMQALKFLAGKKSLYGAAMAP